MNFRKFFEQKLQEAWSANIKAVRIEAASTKISKATRKKIANLAIKTGDSFDTIIAEIATNNYAAASIAVDPKKQVWQKEQQLAYFKYNGISIPNMQMIQLVQSDDGGTQRTKRREIQQQINDLTKPTVVIIDDVLEYNYVLNNNVVFYGSSDTWIERYS